MITLWEPVFTYLSIVGLHCRHRWCYEQCRVREMEISKKVQCCWIFTKYQRYDHLLYVLWVCHWWTWSCSYLKVLFYSNNSKIQSYFLIMTEKQGYTRIFSRMKILWVELIKVRILYGFIVGVLIIVGVVVILYGGGGIMIKSLHCWS